MNKLLQRLVNLFKKGGRTATGKVIAKNITKSSRLERFSQLLKQDVAAEQSFSKMTKQQRISTLSAITSGKSSPETMLSRIKSFAKKAPMQPADRFVYLVKNDIKVAEYFKKLPAPLRQDYILSVRRGEQDARELYNMLKKSASNTKLPAGLGQSQKATLNKSTPTTAAPSGLPGMRRYD
jgi:hypothetical protein